MTRSKRRFSSLRRTIQTSKFMSILTQNCISQCPLRSRGRPGVILRVRTPIPPFRGISCRARLRVFLCMSSSVMPWYTRVSFHTGFRVLRSVFVLSLFDCGRPKKTWSDYTPEFRPARIPAPARDAPAHLGDGEPATPREHQGGALHKHRGLGDAWESLDFVTPWGLFPQGEGKKVPRAGCGGSGHGSHGLKEVAAGNRGAVTRSCVFHEHEFKI